MTKTKNTVELTEMDKAIEEYNNALIAYRQAETNFNWADDVIFDIANEELTLAKKRLEIARNKIKVLLKAGEKMPPMQLCYEPVKYSEY